ncbi:hypothetical protein WKK05_38445 (plasmid) [Nostoc sp. UHCC 0302]|uniref:hypothetical protein n=1 Tax=Nostoc sp. UHCC 0302 TaxID=3134896 RepID=UPI00311CD55A
MLRKRFIKNPNDTDTFRKYFFARIPPQIAITFTPVQLAELRKVFGNRLGKLHHIDIRLSISFFKKSFYLVFLLGKESRLKQRL